MRSRPARRLRAAIDPDVDLHDPAEALETLPREWDLLLVVAAGGVLGAEARYGLALALPHPAGNWPWATLLTNLVGSAVLGALMAALGRLARPPRLLRPFVGVGVCGGFTTFSTFAADTHAVLLAHRPLVALGYVAASLVGCLAVTAAAFVGLGRLLGTPR